MKNRSIGFRLAAWYFLVFACGLAVFGVAAWFAMRASVYHTVDDELRDRVRGVQRFMDRQISSLSILEIRDEFREHSVLGPGGDLFQVCDQQRQWLYRSLPLENNNVAITPPHSLPAPRFETLLVERHSLRFYSKLIVVNGKPYTVQVAAPLNEALESLERFRLMLLFAAPLLLIAASAGGYWLSTRALAPVDEISQAAQRISIENLADRLHVAKTGDQLQRLSETLNAMLSRLEGSVRRITQFTADASHELRAPVSLIRTTAEVAIQRRDRPAEEYLEALEEILAESERTSQVVDSLMLLARADSGKENLECVPVDACVVARGAREQGEKLARSHRLEFNANVPEGPIPIQADADALRRALLILLDNAVKYTPQGGSVTMRLETSDSFAVFSVSDSGIGITKQDLAHVFDRFWRADRVRSREQGGAGLGLSIAKWIVDMHEGLIDVESEQAKGSVFHLRIPLDHEETNMKAIATVMLSATMLAKAAPADTVNFDNLDTGVPPSGWTATKTGTGVAKWTVEKDDSAPSKPNVLKQSGQATYPVCIKDDTSLKDGFVEVKFKPISGKEDQAGGLVWRAKDSNNYYVARANALEDNVTIYHTINGQRTEKKRTNTKVASNQWHTLRIDFRGNHFTVTFDGKKSIEWDDNTFKDAGKVGVWTKADSVTLFDDFSYGAN